MHERYDTMKMIVCMKQVPASSTVEIDEETGIDKAGCTNVLNGPNCVECGHQAWNSCIVKVEKWAGEPLQPDCAWEPREVFKED